MMEMKGDDWAPGQPERGPFGKTVKVNGVLSLRCASTLENGVLMNVLVLFFGMNPHYLERVSDPELRSFWKDAVELAAEQGVTFELVNAVVTEVVE